MPQGARSSATRPRRTPPTSSSRSTRRCARGDPARHRRRRPRRAPRPPARQPAAARAPRFADARARRVVRAPATSPSYGTTATLHGDTGSLCTLLPVGGPASGVTHHRPALPARRRGPAARVDARREQRARPSRRRRSAIALGVLLAVQPDAFDRTGTTEGGLSATRPRRSSPCSPCSPERWSRPRPRTRPRAAARDDVTITLVTHDSFAVSKAVLARLHASRPASR